MLFGCQPESLRPEIVGEPAVLCAAVPVPPHWLVFHADMVQ